MITLPDFHEFQYRAILPWPVDIHHRQSDWISSIESLEQWLEQYCGKERVDWIWVTDPDQEYWQTCIAFRNPRNKTLALIMWS